uniref:Uncharacterized protein n=1 Tax=Peronospora matthiolae TaxID=2874970 RepID=A0AAV1V4H7_9STRA
MTRSRRGKGHRPREHGDGAPPCKLVGQLEGCAAQLYPDRVLSHQALHNSELYVTAAQTSPVPQCSAPGETTSDAVE